MKIIMFSVDKDYVIGLRREIHMYPEVDFDLPKTVAVIKRELTAMNIPYTEKYGKGSVVGYINPDKEGFTLAIRADIDALNITERTGLSYSSKHEGKMHACGHDAHAAMLLGTAKVLKGMENELNCRVKLLFQPSEEGMKSGAVMMIENGVLDDVDVIIGQHVGNGIDAGKMAVCPGISSATSRHFTIEIFGKSAHAAQCHTGIDALAIAVRMYSAIQLIRTREVNPLERCICSVGVLNSGTAQNNVADYAFMKGTIRTLDVGVSEHIFECIQKLAKSLSEETGAEIKVTGPLKSVCVYNNPYLSELALESMKRVLGEENAGLFRLGMGSEDFSRYGDVVPAVFLRLGTRNKAKGITQSSHHDDFNIDEDALECGVKFFVQFVLDNQNGIDKEKMEKADERKKSDD